MLSYLYSAGLGAMLFFVLASLVLNIVSIATTAWTEPNDIGLWLPCFLNGEYRPKCFKTTSQALIATGTAFNCLAFILSVASQASHVLEKFKNTIGQFLVLGAMVTSILCLIFNSIGWYLVFFPTYQNVIIYLFNPIRSDNMNILCSQWDRIFLHFQITLILLCYLRISSDVA